MYCVYTHACVLIYMQISLTRKKLIIEKIARRTSKDREKQLQSPSTLAVH